MCFKASKKLGSAGKFVVGDTLNAVFDLVSACEKITDEQKHHSVNCKHAHKTPALEKLVKVSKKLLADVLTYLEQMSMPVFFKTTIGFYKRIFEYTELFALFDVSTWVPHIELLFRKVDQIYNESTIQDIRDTFYHSGGSQLLIILR